MTLWKLLCGVAGAATLGAAGAANAFVLPDDTGMSDGVYYNSAGVAGGWWTYIEGVESSVQTQQFTTPGGLVSGIVDILPGGDAGESALAGGLSDRVAVFDNGGQVDVYYLSEAASPAEIATFNAATTGLSVLGTITETGHWQDVSSYFGQPSGFVNIQSDVPEPGAWALMLAGFGLAGTALRRRAAVAKA